MLKNFAVAFAVIGAIAAHSGAAYGFCRATTCDPKEGSCGEDSHGCATKGKPVQWKGGNVELRVDESGSELRSLSAKDTQGAVETALSAWMSAECEGGGHPSLGANTELAADLSATFEETGANENDVLYADDGWPYEAGAVAKTLLGFSLDTGNLLDADVVLNSAEFPLSLEPKASDVDLTAVLTHEIGHVLGLAHSDAPGATMKRETRGFATAELLTLEADDIEGICAIYPPGVERSTSGNDSGANLHDSDPSCSVAHGRAEREPWSAVLGALAIGAVARRKATRRSASAKRRY